MKNITVSVPEEVYHRARVKAATKRTSVSKMVRDFLVSTAENDQDDEFARLLKLQEDTLDQIHARGVVFETSDLLTRDQLHDRTALRREHELR